MGLRPTGNWDSHQAPGHWGTSGSEERFEGEFGYQRGAKCVERQSECREVHHLLVRIAKHQSTVNIISSKVGRNKNGHAGSMPRSSLAGLILCYSGQLVTSIVTILVPADPCSCFPDGEVLVHLWFLYQVVVSAASPDALPYGRQVREGSEHARGQAGRVPLHDYHLSFSVKCSSWGGRSPPRSCLSAWWAGLTPRRV